MFGLGIAFEMKKPPRSLSKEKEHDEGLRSAEKIYYFRMIFYYFPTLNEEILDEFLKIKDIKRIVFVNVVLLLTCKITHLINISDLYVKLLVNGTYLNQ